MHSSPSVHVLRTLLNASHVTLENLTLSTDGFAEKLEAARATMASARCLQRLHTLTLEIYGLAVPDQVPASSVEDPSPLAALHATTEILDHIIPDALASLHVSFGTDSLGYFSSFLNSAAGHPSFTAFEQSILRGAAGGASITVSVSSKQRRRNGENFWKPMLARAFPLLYERKMSKGFSQ